MSWRQEYERYRPLGDEVEHETVWACTGAHPRSVEDRWADRMVLEQENSAWRRQQWEKNGIEERWIEREMEGAPLPEEPWNDPRWNPERVIPKGAGPIPTLERPGFLSDSGYVLYQYFYSPMCRVCGARAHYLTWRGYFCGNHVYPR